MKAKLQHLMERLQLKPGQFARMLEINPAIISHILAERNKPGVDLLQKILTKFPQVNPDWLLLDSEEMFRPTYSTDNSPAADSARTAHPSEAHSLSVNPTRELQSDLQQATSLRNTQSSQVNSAILPDKNTVNKPISRVVLFYADGSFESFIPKLNG